MKTQPVALVFEICLVVCFELQDGNTHQPQHSFSFSLVMNSSECLCQGDFVLWSSLSLHEVSSPSYPLQLQSKIFVMRNLFFFLIDFCMCTYYVGLLSTH